MLNSNDIKLIFTVSTTWPTTRTNYCKDSSNFTLWTSFIHHNAPFSKATQFRILKLKAIYCNHQISHCHFHIKRTKLWPNKLLTLLPSSETNKSATDKLFSRNGNMKRAYFTFADILIVIVAIFLHICL